MIDFYPAASESQACWEVFLGDLYHRGLQGKLCQLIATDGGTGLHAALQIIHPKTPVATSRSALAVGFLARQRGAVCDGQMPASLQLPLLAKLRGF